MKDNKPDIILLIFKIIMTSVMMLLLSLADPAIGYSFGAAALIAGPVCMTFAFIGRKENKQ
jgi:hypothetical protein